MIVKNGEWPWLFTKMKKSESVNGQFQKIAIRLFWQFVGPDQFHPNEQFQHSFEEALTTSVMHHLIPRKQFLADQCAANAIFHHNPEKMYLLPCKWNLRLVLNYHLTSNDSYSSYERPDVTPNETQGLEAFHAPRANWIILSQ